MTLLIGILIGIITTVIVYGAYVFMFAFIMWMAVDAAKQDRFWWVLLILGVPLIGAAVYYFTEKKHMYAEAPSHHVHHSETESQHETFHHTHEHKNDNQ